MASKLSLGLVIGGAVSSTVSAAFNTVEGRIKKLEQQGNRAKVLKNTIGETMRLRDEWKKAHDSGSTAASGLLRKLERNIDTLRKQGVQVSKLRQEYQALGRVANGTDLQIKGQQQLAQGKAGLKSSVGQAVVGAGSLAVPTKISAGYQAIIRDIAIKAGVANKPQEQQMTRAIIDTSQQSGMGRNEVADLVNQLVGAGMELDKALSYAPVAAKFAIGQGSGGEDTAKMIMALQQNAKIVDPAVMEKALEGIALQGQAGSFEASDMAKWFPQLLAAMEKSGSTGLDAVGQLGAMLQVQMKTSGGSDEAANNLKNWVEKIGSGEVVKAYEEAGIDYQASLSTGIQRGMSTLESSFALAQRYVESTNPEQAKKMAEAMAGISKETDPAKAKSMLESLEKALRTGDLFADMQVKAALTAFSQNKALYEQLKGDAKSATGILDKNLAERRQTSSQIWSETFQSVNDSMRSIGDAIRPMTDGVAKAITATAKAFTGLSDDAQPVVAGIVAVGAGFVALKSAFSMFKIGKGLLNIGRGALMGKSGDVQKVFVTNSEDGEDGKDDKPEGKREIALSLLETGLKALGGKGGDDGTEGAEEGDSKGFDLVDTGLKVLDLFRSGKEDGGDAGGDSGPQKVFVVNAGDIGGGVGGQGEQRGRRSRRRRGGRAGGSGGPGAGNGGSGRNGGPRPGQGGRPPMPPRPPLPLPPTPLPVPAGGIGRMAKVAGAVGKIGALGKLVPGGTFVEAGMKAYDTFENAETQDEKAEGYGGAAGGLGGALAGGAAGAAIGSVVPVIGTVIGGAIGALIGGIGGDKIGSWMGKKIFGSDDAESEQAEKEKPAAPVPGDVVRSLAAATPAPTSMPAIAKASEPAKQVPKVDQQFAFSPSLQVTVQGDVKDPAQVAREVEPYMRRMFDEYSRQAAARQLSDEPHV